MRTLQWSGGRYKRGLRVIPEPLGGLLRQIGKKMSNASRKISVMQVDIYICPCGTAHTNGVARMCSACERDAVNLYYGDNKKILELMNEIQWRYPENERWSILRCWLEKQEIVNEAAQHSVEPTCETCGEKLTMKCYNEMCADHD